ncbi:MAG: anti-sigma factor domain-containing protein [Clostridia bacterium]|nr:anti-sigma factor domain-containing protein [Clostridia bacterium]
MKGIVVDIADKYAVILDKQGSFIKIKNTGNLKIGYEVEAPSVATLNISAFNRIASIAAVFLIILGLGYGVYSYNQPFSYVDIDINPSIELTINRYDRIIKAEAINNDGKVLLNAGSYKNKGIEDGIETLLEAAAKNGYIKSDSENAVVFTVVSSDDEKAEKIQNEIKTTAGEELKQNKDNANIVIERATIERHREAKKIGLSPGKLALIEKAVELEPGKKVEDFKDKPVKEIIKSIKEDSKLKDKNDDKKDKSDNNENSKLKLKDKTNANINEKAVKDNHQTSETMKNNKDDNKKESQAEKPKKTSPRGQQVEEKKTSLKNNKKDESYKQQASDKKNTKDNTVDRDKGKPKVNIQHKDSEISKGTNSEEKKATNGKNNSNTPHDSKSYQGKGKTKK